MDRRKFLSVVVAVGIAGCPEDPPDENGETETPEDRVELVAHYLVRIDVGTEEERAIVEGTVRIKEPDIQYIELRVQFYDADGEQLDSTNERIQELEEGTQGFAVEYPRRGEDARAVDDYDIEIQTIL